MFVCLTQRDGTPVLIQTSTITSVRGKKDDYGNDVLVIKFDNQNEVYVIETLADFDAMIGPCPQAVSKVAVKKSKK